MSIDSEFSECLRYVPAKPTDQKVSALHQGEVWVICAGQATSETMVPIKFDTKDFGVSAIDQQRLCKALADRWPTCVIEVWPAGDPDDGDDE